MEGAVDSVGQSSSGKNHKKYRKDKPWDTDDIDHWKIEEWKPDFLKGPFLEESSFATLFPKYREKYLREVWPIVTAALEVKQHWKHNIKQNSFVTIFENLSFTLESRNRVRAKFGRRLHDCAYDSQNS